MDTPITHQEPAPTSHTLPRHGKEPLAFVGREILNLAGRETNSRRHNLRVFLTTGGKSVVQIQYFTEWKEEVDSSHVFIVDGREKIVDILEEYDPLCDIVGFPDGDQFVRKQIRLEQEITLKFDAMVSVALELLGVTEAVD